MDMAEINNKLLINQQKNIFIIAENMYNTV